MVVCAGRGCVGAAVRLGPTWTGAMAHWGGHLDRSDDARERAPDAGAARVNELSESRARAGGGPAEKESLLTPAPKLTKRGP